MVLRLTGGLLASAFLALACRTPIPRREILYQSTRPGDTEDIWALNPRTGAERRITRGDSSYANGEAAWSPDGRRVAFARELHDHDELYVIDSIGAAPRRIGVDAPRSLAFPDWSPDGGTLLFNAGTTIDRLGVYLIRADGSGLQQVLPDSVNYRCPSWAPDGRRFTVSESTPISSQVLEVDLASGLQTSRAFSDSTYLDCPQWSPDGLAILVTVFHGGVDPLVLPAARVTADLQVIDLVSSRIRPLTRGPGVNNYGRWARDSRWIVFQSDRHSPPENDSVTVSQRLNHLELYLVRVDGKRMRRLTTNEHFDAHPSW